MSSPKSLSTIVGTPDVGWKPRKYLHDEPECLFILGTAWRFGTSHQDSLRILRVLL
jgi:hypothetical protein